MNKIISISVYGIICALLMNTQAFADNTCGENCTWEVVGNELKIHGTGEMSNYSYGSAPWYAQKNSIRKVTIDNGITSIGSVAFYHMTINEIQLPDSLKTIKNQAFREATLNSLELPKNMERVESKVFCGTSVDLIINPNDKLQISPAVFEAAGSSWYSGFDSHLICRGNQSECDRITKPVLDWYETHQNPNYLYHGLLASSLYQKYDTDGKPLELCNTNGCTKYTYDAGGNLIRQIDANNQILWRRRIYTVEEATKVAKPQGNTFTLRYR